MRKLVLLADGGALSDFNDRLKGERPQDSARFQERPKGEDFVRLPEKVLELVRQNQHTQTDIECPIEYRIFCVVGSEKAKTFVATMAETWTVRTFPLTLAKYERAGNDDTAGRHQFRLRFHAYLGYVLGLITQAEHDRLPIVGILTDDPHLLPCMSDSRSRGCDVQMIWWESAITDEVSFQAARQGVPMLRLSSDDPASTTTPDGVLQSLVPPRSQAVPYPATPFGRGPKVEFVDRSAVSRQDATVKTMPKPVRLEAGKVGVVRRRTP